ncbi:MAG: RNA 2',3'-cyclic phosphodiesterase [Haloarculaceae archaeon]
MRAFVSVDLDGLTEEVAAVQAELESVSGLNLVDPAGAHVTLKFLGEVEEAERDLLDEELAAAVEASGVGPFDAEFGGLGVFPHPGYISVVWVGVREGRGDAELTALHEAVEERTTALGFDPEEHAFTPHVTLGRMEHAGGKERVQELLETWDPTVGTLDVTEVRLTESTPTHEGPEYSTAARFPLRTV